MAKLSKMQAQAIISKLGRESKALRARLIEKETRDYTLSDNAKELIKLIEKRDNLKELADNAADAVRKFAESIGLAGIYNYTKTDEAIAKIKTKEIEDKYPNLDLDAALDDLIIDSVEDDFSVDGFIESYLKQVSDE